MKVTYTIEHENRKTVLVHEDEVSKGLHNDSSMYATYFDSSCAAWSKDTRWNLMYLRAQEQYATDLLKARGHLFLNEVYDMLGLPRTKIGAIVGWIYIEHNPIGDNCVDFGIFDTDRDVDEEEYDEKIFIDFNVDGCILEYLD